MQWPTRWCAGTAMRLIGWGYTGSRHRTTVDECRVEPLLSHNANVRLMD